MRTIVVVLSLFSTLASASDLTTRLEPLLRDPTDDVAHELLLNVASRLSKEERAAAVWVLASLCDAAATAIDKKHAEHFDVSAMLPLLEKPFVTLTQLTDDPQWTDPSLAKLAQTWHDGGQRRSNAMASALARLLPLPAHRGGHVLAPLKWWLTEALFGVPARPASELFVAIARVLQAHPEEAFLTTAENQTLAQRLQGQRAHWAPDAATIEANLDGAYLKFMDADPDVPALTREAMERGLRVDALVAALELTPALGTQAPTTPQPRLEGFLVTTLTPDDASASYLVRLVALDRSEGVTRLKDLEAHAGSLAREHVKRLLQTSSGSKINDCLAALIAPER